MRRWYQNIEIDGVDAVFEGPERKNSKFWNEGKWNNFIEPLLPKGRTFIEIGCNAGLFLKMATDAGFRDVIGIEASSRIMQQAECFRESNGGTYKLLLQYVGENFALHELPLADVVLLANVHYYFPVATFSKLVDNLKSRCLYCIIVAGTAKRRQGRALYDLNSVRGYFRDWQEMKVIEGLEEEGDPAPRTQMYGVLFKGNLTAIQIDDMYSAWQEAAKSRKHRSHGLAPAMKDFFEKVLRGEAFKYEDTQFYQYWRTRQPDQSPEWTRELLANRKSLAEDIQENGMREPIYFDQKMKLLDGIHRLNIAKVLGYKYVLARVL